MHPTGLVALPPGPGPPHPLTPREAVAHVLAMLRDESLCIAEVRKVVTLRRLGGAAAVGGDAYHVVGRLISGYACGDRCHLPRLKRWLTALFVRDLQGGEDLPLAHATPAHRSGEAGECVVAPPRWYAFPDGCGRPLDTLSFEEAYEPQRRVRGLRFLRRNYPLVRASV